jgi:hypothetical protein
MWSWAGERCTARARTTSSGNVYHYRRNSLPIITRAITTRAKHADVQSIVDETIIIAIIDRRSASSFSQHCIVAWGVGGVIAASDWAGVRNVRVVLG